MEVYKLNNNTDCLLKNIDPNLNLKSIKLPFDELKHHLRISTTTVMVCLMGGFKLIYQDHFQEIDRGDIIILSPAFSYLTDNRVLTKILLIEISNLEINGKIKFHRKINWDRIPSVNHKTRYLPTKAIFKILNPSQLFLLIGPQKILPCLDYQLRGPDNFVLSLAKTLPGEGPILHYHLHSTEHFYVIKGTYQVTIDDNLEKIYLNPGEIIQIPPRLLRGFIQISENDEGILMPIVVGTNNERKDIMFPNRTKYLIKDKLRWYQKPILKIAEKFNLQFGNL